MQFTFTHTHEIDFPPFDETREIELTVTAEYHEAVKGSRGECGEPEEPDEDARIEIISITDKAENEYPTDMEGVESAAWDEYESGLADYYEPCSYD